MTGQAYYRHSGYVIEAAEKLVKGSSEKMEGTHRHHWYWEYGQHPR